MPRPFLNVTFKGTGFLSAERPVTIIWTGAMTSDCVVEFVRTRSNLPAGTPVTFQNTAGESGVDFVDPGQLFAFVELLRTTGFEHADALAILPDNDPGKSTVTLGFTTSVASSVPASVRRGGKASSGSASEGGSASGTDQESTVGQGDHPVCWLPYLHCWVLRGAGWRGRCCTRPQQRSDGPAIQTVAVGCLPYDATP